jgi:hypothetical protein
MGRFTSISAAIRTRTNKFSGTSARPWLVVNQRDCDCLNRPMLSAETVGSFQRGQSLFYYQSLPAGGMAECHDDCIGQDDMYVRLDSPSANLWEPEVVIVWGRSKEKGQVPLALELDQPLGLSTDQREGFISAPVRRVLLGDDDTMIRRLVMVVVTYDAPYAGTDDPIWVRVMTPKGRVVYHIITDTPQMDLEINSANIYEIPVETPFTRGQLRAGEPCEITLGIHGSDKWIPKKVRLFGLDDPSERPEYVVPLAGVREPGPLSADPKKGVPTISLPVD